MNQRPSLRSINYNKAYFSQIYQLSKHDWFRKMVNYLLVISPVQFAYENLQNLWHYYCKIVVLELKIRQKITPSVCRFPIDIKCKAFVVQRSYNFTTKKDTIVSKKLRQSVPLFQCSTKTLVACSMK